jgi:Zn-finger nucleic acid-binding protein
MICPNDNVEMQQVKVESHYGQTVALDQCPECGGIWFDQFELASVKQGEAEKIELLNVDALRATSPIEKTELLCPKDSAKLVNFEDPFFPKTVIISRCPVCNGFWLNRGEFIKYQNYRESLKQPRVITAEDEKVGQELARMLAENKTEDATEALGKLGSFLSMPMDNVTGSPLEYDELSGGEKSTMYFISSALAGVLRLFIRV